MISDCHFQYNFAQIRNQLYVCTGWTTKRDEHGISYQCRLLPSSFLNFILNACARTNWQVTKEEGLSVCPIGAAEIED